MLPINYINRYAKKMLVEYRTNSGYEFVRKESGNNFSVQAAAEDAIKQKKYHRVDISNMIKQQNTNVFQTMLQKLFHQNSD